MAIPDLDSLMLATLKALSGGGEIHISEVRDLVAKEHDITPEERQETSANGKTLIFANRVNWATADLKGAGLLERPSRGFCRITADGEKVLADSPSRIDRKFLKTLPVYIEWEKKLAARKKEKGEEIKELVNNLGISIKVGTPEEIAEKASLEIKTALETELLERVYQAPPEFLERLIIDLLGKMGYGGGDPKMGSVTGKSGDGGIDGKIKEDALGLDEVYVQAKRYDPQKVVGGSDIRNFVGAIDAEGVSKGVFVTTAKFNQAAKAVAHNSSKRIILIDGEELTRLMVENGIGVREKTTIEIKRIDEDYFDLEGGS
ncbi:MAG: restriction endonuclease [Nitrospinae bacterium]|nr:restriction endonuclease [Nitrospinota bacterium]